MYILAHLGIRHQSTPGKLHPHIAPSSGCLGWWGEGGEGREMVTYNWAKPINDSKSTIRQNPSIVHKLFKLSQIISQWDPFLYWSWYAGPSCPCCFDSCPAPLGPTHDDITLIASQKQCKGMSMAERWSTTYSHTHTHIYIYIYIHMYICEP